MKRKSSQGQTGYYLYGFVRADAELQLGEIGVPNDGQPTRVYTLAEGPIAAVVSEHAANEKLMPLRKNLGPHNAVVREVMRQTTIIPMAFGHLAKGKEEVSRALRRNKTRVAAELDRLWAKVEMGLKVKWDVENIFEHFISLDPELHAFRDQVFGRSLAASQAEKIELGRMFEERRSREREKEVERVTEALRASVVDVRVNPPKGETTVMDLAFLVDRDVASSFEEKVCQIAAEYPAQYIFDYSGPWAPFDFVELDFATRATEVV